MRAFGFLRNRAGFPIDPRLLALFAGLSQLLAAGTARAALTGDFADALDIDSGYVTGANGATDIAFSGDGRAVITTKTGNIVVRLTDGTKKTLQGTFPDLDSASEKGLNGVFADPRDPKAFFFYADNGPSTTDKHQVYHAVLNDDSTITVDLDNPVVAEGANPGDPGLEGPANHDGGGLFIYNNFLYVSVGDTGQNATPPTNKYTSCLNKGNGKILRLNLDGTIPTDNPLSGEAMVTSCDRAGTQGVWGTAAPDKRIYAWGLRNAWRYWVDPHTGRMWIGDVGETTREEISISAPAASYQGEHFGYPFHEGTTDWSMDNGELRLDKDCDQNFQPSRACTAPVYDYGRTGGANCVIGGIIPEGCGWDTAFGGKLYYFFMDNGAAWTKAMEVKPDRSGVVSNTPVDVGTFSGTGPVSLRQGPGGAIYLVNNKEGSVYEIKPKEQTGDACVSTGGMGGMGGAGATAGASATSGAGGSSTTAGTGNATAGTGGTMSAGGRTGTAGTGGTTGGTGGTGGTSTGGTATGGASATSGAGTGAGQTGGAAKPSEGDDKSGCGCRAAGSESSTAGLILAGLGITGLTLRRRRR